MTIASALVRIKSDIDIAKSLDYDAVDVMCAHNRLDYLALAVDGLFAVVSELSKKLEAK